MARPEKEQQVELLTDKLNKARVAVLTDYRGLTVSQIQDLRGRLRGGEVEYRVVKNTLARLAAAASGHDDFQPLLLGPVGIAFGYDDLATPIKLVNEFVRSTRLKLDIVGGLVEGRVMSADQLKQLADLPIPPEHDDPWAVEDGLIDVLEQCPELIDSILHIPRRLGPIERMRDLFRRVMRRPLDLEV